MAVDTSKALKSIQTNLDNFPKSLNDVRSETKGLMDTLLNKLQGVNYGADVLLKSQNDSVKGFSSEMVKMENSLAGRMTPVRNQIKKDVLEILNRRKETTIPVPVPSGQQVLVGKECIDALLSKTITMASNNTNTERARVYLEKLYSLGGLVSSVMEYLRSKPDVKIMIEYEADEISRLKSKIVNHDGKERDGSDVTAHADFKDNTIYLSTMGNSENWVLVQLAHKMTQLAVSMAFQNGGSPYDKGDTVHQNQFREILVEAERKNADHEVLDISLVSALERTETLAKEIYLISAVPWFIVDYGTAGGARRLQEQLPKLLAYYEEHVMPKLRG